jgi:hypothetical protein
MVTRFWFFAFFQVFFVSNAAALSVFIRTGSYQIGTESVYKTTIRQDSLHDITPTPYYLSQSTFLQITIHNLDTVLHELAWNDQVSGVVVPALGNVTITRNITGVQIFTLFCNDFSGKLLGGSFSIVSGVPTTHLFYWELWETQASINAQIASQNLISFPDPFRPNVFTINGTEYPLNMNDTLGLVQGQVGDSIYICAVNAGAMPHSFHFHGYHFKIMHSTKLPNRMNWEKDSGPILQNDAMILLLVPDKPGAYPVHDHNLTANTANGGYPGGMMTMLMIEP